MAPDNGMTYDLDHVMQEHGVFPAEQELWRALGIYIPTTKDTADGYTDKAQMWYTATMEHNGLHGPVVLMWHIPYQAGMDIRKNLIRLSQLIPAPEPPDPLDDLEVSRVA